MDKKNYLQNKLMKINLFRSVFEFQSNINAKIDNNSLAIDSTKNDLIALFHIINMNILHLRATMIKEYRSNQYSGTARKPRPAIMIPLSSSYKKLEKKFPSVFPIWHELFENGRREYENAPEQNLSVDGNDGAEAFRLFLMPHIRGHVLDIGCGPQEMPVYLKGHPYDRLAGLDPLPSRTQRNFEFAEGIAEFNPWPDEEFDVVIAATSLDHVISLDIGAVRNQSRYATRWSLRSVGRLHTWIGAL